MKQYSLIEWLQIMQKIIHFIEVGNSCRVIKHDYWDPHQHINTTSVLLSTLLTCDSSHSALVFMWHPYAQFDESPFISRFFKALKSCCYPPGRSEFIWRHAANAILLLWHQLN